MGDHCDPSWASPLSPKQPRPPPYGRVGIATGRLHLKVTQNNEEPETTHRHPSPCKAGTSALQR